MLENNSQVRKYVLAGICACMYSFALQDTLEITMQGPSLLLSSATNKAFESRRAAAALTVADNERYSEHKKLRSIKFPLL